MSLRMITFSCHVCRSSLSMDDQYAGQPARCPTCRAVVTVPAQSKPAAVPPIPTAAIHRPAPQPAPYHSREPVRRFGFDCPWCSSRLEATMLTAGQQGQCPTCGNTIRIPILDRYGRLIDPDTNKVLKPDPHPVHAYAAAGDRAPKIVRSQTGSQSIQCSRCSSVNPINSNNCRSCGIPFTLEGTVRTESGGTNGFATTSLVLGILGIPSCMIFLPSVLAIVFGVIALTKLRGDEPGGPRKTAIAGICCGVIGLLMSVLLRW
jgi:Domain of unknown function (DUF4190)